MNCVLDLYATSAKPAALQADGKPPLLKDPSWTGPLSATYLWRLGSDGNLYVAAHDQRNDFPFNTGTHTPPRRTEPCACSRRCQWSARPRRPRQLPARLT